MRRKAGKKLWETSILNLGKHEAAKKRSGVWEKSAVWKSKKPRDNFHKE